MMSKPSVPADLIAISSVSIDSVFDLERAGDLIRSPIIPEVIAPLMAQARSELSALLGRNELELQDRAFDDLIGNYQQTLARLTNLVLIQRFSSFHLVNNPLWRPQIAEPGPAPAGKSRRMLDAYIAWEEIEKVLAPDGPYPELAALLGKARKNWLYATEELLLRVAGHRDAIAGLLGVTTEQLGSLTGARFGISDPHNEGRTVAILSFGNRKVVYKPRPIEAELAWNAIATDVVHAVMAGSHYLPKVLSFEGYGFMEFVYTSDCADEDAVKRCYFRYGMLTAIAHALGACDLHHENILVAGEHPVVIDSEPLFRARLAMSDSGDSRLEVEQNLSMADIEVRESVLELGILPIVMTSPLAPRDQRDTTAHPAAQEIQIGALCAYARNPLTDMLPCALGSDDIQIRAYPVASGEFPNLPTCGGTPQFPKDYLDDITAGFSATHAYFRANKARYISDGGILDQFANCRIRLLARPTMDYMSVLSRSLSPEVLRSSEARRRLIAADLEAVGKYRMDTVSKLLPHEINSLMDGDVPLFDLASSDVACAGAKLYASPLACAKTRLDGMDEFDCFMQVAQIREQLQRKDEVIAGQRPRRFERAAARQHAFDIVDGLASSALQLGDSASWVYATYAPGFSTTMCHIDRESLYEGAAGTALVVAEAARLAGRDDWMRLAISVLKPVIERRETRSALRSGGMARGIGGLIYTLTRIAAASGQQQLLDVATDIALEHGLALAQNDTLDEVLYGRAGLLLALLALHRRSPSSRLLAIADATAAELVNRASVDGDSACWPLAGGKSMPHVSHGSSGIAMALSRWARLREDERAARLAVQALQHDDSFWIGHERGWADGRFMDMEMRERTNWSWCNGRSGALLARAAVADALGTTFMSSAVEQAMDAGGSDILSEVSPGLCCGTVGALDALISVQSRHPSANIDACVSRASTLLTCNTPASQYSMMSGSLFSGTAGLAFGLLRVACPEEIESVLWFG